MHALAERPSRIRAAWLIIALIVLAAILGGCPPIVPPDGNSNGNSNDNVSMANLTVQVQGQGVVDPGSGEFEPGSRLSLRARPATGWRFDHWAGDMAGSANPMEFTIESDMSVMAVFAPIAQPGTEWSLAVQIQGEGSTDAPTGKIANGTTVNVTATPAAGWTFDHWMGAATGSQNPIAIKMDANKTLVAVFVRETVQYALTIEIEGDGVVTPGSGTYAADQTVTLEAVPHAGSRFVRWEGDATGTTAELTIAVTRNLSIRAIFATEGSVAPVFEAVYDWIVDDDALNDAIHVAAMSRDGEVVYFTNGGADDHRRLYRIHPDGSGLQSWAVPAGPGALGELAVDGDGSRAFLGAPYEHAFFRFEGGAITGHETTSAQDGPLGPTHIYCTADGEWLYFVNWTGPHPQNCWRVRHDGSGLQLVFRAAQVSRNGGHGWGIADWAVSADGGTIAFFCTGYSRDDGFFQSNAPDVFVFRGGAFTRLTTDEHSKGYIAISGDGSRIVYADYADYRYYAIAATGGERIAVATASHNFGGLRLNYEGTEMVLNDSAQRGGRLMQTNGSGGRDLFPGWNVVNIHIGVLDSLRFSDNGLKILFRYEYASWPFKRALYFGHLHTSQAVDDAPSLGAITFSPMSMSRSETGVKVVMNLAISDPDGPADILHVSNDSLVDGAVRSHSESPANFPFAPVDSGAGDDVAAGDGIFTSFAGHGAKIADIPSMQVRIAIEDKSHTVVVVDVPFVLLVP